MENSDVWPHMTSLHPEWPLFQNYGNVMNRLGGETVYVPCHCKETKHKNTFCDAYDS